MQKQVMRCPARFGNGAPGLVQGQQEFMAYQGVAAGEAIPLIGVNIFQAVNKRK